jgi:hypothetical protein
MSHQGTSTAELAKIWPLAKGTSLKGPRNGVQLRDQGLADEDFSAAAKLCTDGMSLKLVRERFGYDAEAVRKRLVAAGVQIRVHGLALPQLLQTTTHVDPRRRRCR